LKIDTKTFVVVDKFKYDLVLENIWLEGLEYRIDKYNVRYWKNNKEKKFYYIRNSINILFLLLQYIYSINCYFLISLQLIQIKRL